MTKAFKVSPNLSRAIDNFGALSAQIANLEAQKKVLRNIIVDAVGEGAVEGEMFRVTVSVADRDNLDMAAVRAKLSHQFITANTTTTQVTTVKATARNDVNVKQVA